MSANCNCKFATQTLVTEN